MWGQDNIYIILTLLVCTSSVDLLINRQDMVKNQNAHLFVSIVFGLIWIIDGLIINLLQFTCYLLIRPFSKAAFRKINYYLIYSSWSQVIALAEYWTKCKITVYYPDEDSEKYFGREHSITLMNHKYEVDWLYTWIICDKFHALGVCV